jgi:hypothetical protein
VRGLDSDVTAALVSRPLELDEGHVGPAATAALVLGWGRRGDAAWAHVEANDLIAREALRRVIGTGL